MPDHSAFEPPSTREAVRKVLETQRVKVERWKAARIREIVRDADRELHHLERTIRVLTPEADSGRERSKPRDSGKRKNTAAAAAERREAVTRLLDERVEALAVREISRSLRISEFATRSALKRLIGDGRVRRIGTGSGTRYESASKRPQAAVLGNTGGGIPGTIEGRVLALVQNRSYATLEELGQALGADREELRRVCGGLVAEGEIAMSRRTGRPVYVRRTAA